MQGILGNPRKCSRAAGYLKQLHLEGECYRIAAPETNPNRRERSLSIRVRICTICIETPTVPGLKLVTSYIGEATGYLMRHSMQLNLQ
jgi:hypothetical protein